MTTPSAPPPTAPGSPEQSVVSPATDALDERIEQLDATEVELRARLAALDGP